MISLKHQTLSDKLDYTCQCVAGTVWDHNRQECSMCFFSFIIII